MTFTLIGQIITFDFKPQARHTGRNKKRRMAVEEGTGELMLEGEKMISPSVFKQASPLQVRQDNVLLHPDATKEVLSREE